MSAWWTSKRHIDLIVTAAVQLKVIEPERATRTGSLLRSANARSLENRYGDDLEQYRSDIEGYQFTPAPEENLVGVYCALRSYNYQTCEMVNYNDSFARSFVESLSVAIEKKLGKTSDEAWQLTRPIAHGENGYWCIEEWPELISN